MNSPIDNLSYTIYNGIKDILEVAIKEVSMGPATTTVLDSSLVDDKGTWAIRTRLRDPATGKILRKSKSTGLKVKDNTKRKAEKMLQEYVRELEDGHTTTSSSLRPHANDGSPKFSIYVERFLQKKEATRREITVKAYRDYARTHILPELGDIPVKDLCLADIQDYYNKRFSTMSVVSLKKHHVVITGAIVEAIRDHVITTNCAEFVEFPTQQKFEGKSYDGGQLRKLLQAAFEHGEPLCSAIVLASVYGLRRSEILGLRWQDVDFGSKTLHICNTVCQNGSLIVEQEKTKTKASNRTLVMVDSTIGYLQELKEKQYNAGLALDKVCVWPNGKAVSPSYLTRATRDLMRKSGLEQIRLHDLRHTAATMLAHNNATPKQVQHFLGHEKVSTTLDIYTHLVDEDKVQTSRLMDGIVRSIL